MDTIRRNDEVHQIAIPQYIGRTGQMFGYPAHEQRPGDGMAASQGQGWMFTKWVGLR